MMVLFLLAAAVTRTAAFSASGSPHIRASFARVRSASSLSAFDASTVAFFPGQGAQAVGMCKDLPGAKDYFDRASTILGYDLWERVMDGPKETLDTTAVSQPAIFVASMAAASTLPDTPTAACGLSLGEYSALCYAGAISFEDGVRITKIRGEAMQAASDASPSGMVSVIGLKRDAVESLCAKASEISGEKVAVANYLCDGNYAVSGSMKACDTVCEIAKPDFKARMTVKLAVAGAFHTEFMSTAVDALGAVLKDVEIKPPRIPVISNVNAEPHTDDPQTIRETLAKQVTSPVRWEETMQSLISNGLKSGYEVGPGKVIAGIMKRTDKTKTIVDVDV